MRDPDNRFAEGNILRAVWIVFNAHPVAPIFTRAESNAVCGLLSSPPPLHTAEQIPSRIHIHGTRFAVSNTQQKRILLIVDPIEFMWLFIDYRLLRTLGLNRKKWTSPKEIRVAVTGNQTTNEIDTHILLARHTGGKSDRRKQMFDK